MSTHQPVADLLAAQRALPLFYCGDAATVP
jgi:hypothetical protein